MKRKLTLRDAQKAQTRERILDAARSVFYKQGYYGATVDEIVADAGASRPTFYLHFRDKEQVLDALTSEYAARAAKYMERMPGPHPTVQELEHWLVEIGVFLRQERAVFSVLTEVNAHGRPSGPQYGLTAIDSWIGGLSARAPAFAAAISSNRPDFNAKARATLLIIEMVWAGGAVAADKDADFTKETVALVAQSLYEFLNDPRFHATSSSGRKALRQLPAGRKLKSA